MMASGCDLIGAGVYYQPQGIPIKVAVDVSGKVSVSADAIQLSTPIGVFGVDLNLHTPELANKRVFAVRMNGYDTAYDLQDNQVTHIEFQPGHYHAINLQLQDDDLIVELEGTTELNAEPIGELLNSTAVAVSVGRRSCASTAFTPNMRGVVARAVRLRNEPEIPQDVDQNWAGSLKEGESLTVKEVLCREGVWLYVVRDLSPSDESSEGWAKEWGLTNDLQEQTYIVPASP
jgi:hypothetical protein